MGKLNYNIYSHISDDAFIEIGKVLAPLESKMASILKLEGWRLHHPVSTSDALAVDFIKRDSIFNGNIGFTFDDIPRRTSFTFYVTKSFDENKYRFFLRNYIFVNKNIDFFENDIMKFTNIALEKYDNWSKNDIITLGVKDKLG